MELQQIKSKLKIIPPLFVEEIVHRSTIQTFPKGTELVKAHDYVHVLPLVLDGLIKVYTKFNDRELLLYYIEPAQSCVMSFSAGLKHHPSRIHAITEETSTVMLIPIEVLPNWIKNYPHFNTLFFEQYDLRYADLLDTIEHMLINKLDERLLSYLIKKSTMLQKTTLNLTHSQIANEIGTVREVVSRMLKKLENDDKIELTSRGIKIFGV